ncbi:MAG: hypothetical protein J0H99_21160, partial [Rhodospirillales bacterium]|nr:hypothetical protein [Rhodospirillales bacterium]
RGAAGGGAIRMSGAARLRQVTAWDAALLATLHAGAFGADAWSETVFAAQFALPGVFALVHEAGGLVLARVAADEAEILTIGVVEAARGQGVGAALLRATFDAVIAAGAVVLFLEVWCCARTSCRTQPPRRSRSSTVPSGSVSIPSTV